MGGVDHHAGLEEMQHPVVAGVPDVKGRIAVDKQSHGRIQTLRRRGAVGTVEVRRGRVQVGLPDDAKGRGAENRQLDDLRKDRDAMIAAVGHVDIASGIGRDVARGIEPRYAVSGAELPERPLADHDRGAGPGLGGFGRVGIDQHAVGAGIGNIEESKRIDENALGRQQRFSGNLPRRGAIEEALLAENADGRSGYWSGWGQTPARGCCRVSETNRFPCVSKATPLGRRSERAVTEAESELKKSFWPSTRSAVMRPL